MSRNAQSLIVFGLLTAVGAIAQTSDPSPTATPSPAVTPAADLVRNATLNGAQEVPPIATSATGDSQVTIRRTDNSIEYTLNVTGLENITVAHIHIGEPGVAGPIIFPLTAPVVGSPTTGRLTAQDFTPQPDRGINTFEDALLAIEQGRTYVNVHTTANPNGEIRGQLIDQAAGQASPSPGATATPGATTTPIATVTPDTTAVPLPRTTSLPATTTPQAPY